jgi:ankyrin repeat protein
MKQEEIEARKQEQILEQKRLEAEEAAQRRREEEERRQREEALAAERAEKERQRKEAEKQRIISEDKATGGANSRLRNGILGGNLEMVKKAIDDGANASAIFEDGQNTLILAIKNAKIADFLIQKGADVNQKRDLDGRTALHLADNEDVAIILSTYNTDLEVRDSKGNTPLEVAIMNNKTSTAIYLIEKGANINSNNGTPLSLACGMENAPIQIDVARLLLIKGVKVNDSPDGMSYPLHLAAKNDNYELANLLLQYGADEDLRDKNSSKAKSYAKSKELRKLLK